MAVSGNKPWTRMLMKRIFSAAAAVGVLGACALAHAEDILPKHITPQAQASIKKGLDYLAKVQTDDGSYTASPDGRAYPVAMTSLAGMAFLANGNTTSRGPYSD